MRAKVLLGTRTSELGCGFRCIDLTSCLDGLAKQFRLGDQMLGVFPRTWEGRTQRGLVGKLIHSPGVQISGQVVPIFCSAWLIAL